MDELLQWPWRRFESFYGAYMKRSIVESLERRKDAMIAALWANSNYDDDKGSRRTAIEEIEESFQAASHVVYHGVDPSEEDIDEENPFFSPAMRAARGTGIDAAPTATVNDVVGNDYSKHIDQ